MVGSFYMMLLFEGDKNVICAVSLSAQTRTDGIKPIIFGILSGKLGMVVVGEFECWLPLASTTGW